MILLIDPQYNGFTSFADDTGDLIKKLIRNHYAAHAVAEHSWIDLFIGDTIVAMYNNGSFIGVGIAIIKSIKPE